MHVQVQRMQAINALNVSSWHRGPQPADDDLTVRSTPGQQQEVDSKGAGSESPTCARCLALRSFAAPAGAYHCAVINRAYARSDFHISQCSGFRVSLG